MTTYQLIMPFNIFIIETKCNYFNYINRLGAAQLDIFSLILLFFNGSIYFYFSFSAKFKKIHLPFAHFQFIYRVWMTRRRKKNWEKKKQWVSKVFGHSSEQRIQFDKLISPIICLFSSLSLTLKDTLIQYKCLSHLYE